MEDIHWNDKTKKPPPMNTVNKEVAIKLKEAGFDVPTRSHYHQGVKTIYECLSAENHNAWDCYSSACDFLTAADWLREKKIADVQFNPYHTLVNIIYGDEKLFDDPDHRNSALLFALNQITTKK